MKDIYNTQKFIYVTENITKKLTVCWNHNRRKWSQVVENCTNFHMQSGQLRFWFYFLSTNDIISDWFLNNFSFDILWSTYYQYVTKWRNSERTIPKWSPLSIIHSGTNLGPIWRGKYFFCRKFHFLPNVFGRLASPVVKHSDLNSYISTQLFPRKKKETALKCLFTQFFGPVKIWGRGQMYLLRHCYSVTGWHYKILIIRFDVPWMELYEDSKREQRCLKQVLLTFSSFV